MPSRLLDLSSPDGQRITLVDTKPLSHTVRYIALSHTWGSSSQSSSILTTTTDTVEHRKRGIKHASLPANFRDAVTVARAFHVRYL